MSGKRDLDRDSLFKSILGNLGSDDDGETTNLIPIAQIRFNSDQPRRHFDEQSLSELAESITKRGVLEPVLVRRRGDGFELIAGERRTRAAQQAGLEQIPAVILTVDDDAALEISIMENLQREDLNAVEETEAVLRLLQLHLGLGKDRVITVLQEIYNQERGRGASDTVAEDVKDEVRSLLARLGRFTPSSFYVNRVPILDFPPELLSAVRSGKLEFTKAQALARIKSDSQRKKLLEEAIKEGLTLSQIRARSAGTKVTAGVGEKQLAETRKLLTDRRLARLSAKDRQRANKLLAELRELLG